jgi:cysteine desulfurase
MKTKKRIYLDYAASTPVDARVAAAMTEAQSLSANPSSPYMEGREARLVYDTAKKQIGMVLGVRADEIVLTSGATESDNLAILGAVRPNISSGAHIVTIQTEHKSVLEPIAQLEREGATVSYVRTDKEGRISLDDLQSAIGDSTVLVSVSYASSEIGTIQPMAKIGRLIEKIRKNRVEKGSATPLLLHSDCSAAAGLLPLSPARLSIDLMTLNPSKFYGPHGSGILYVKSGSGLGPMLFGGGQQNGLRPGTEDIASAIGVAKALELVESRRPEEVQRLTALRDKIAKELTALPLDVVLNGSAENRLANNISLSFAGLNGEDIVARFDAAGVSVSTGAACSAADEAPSHVILALGRSKDQAQGSLRITLGQQTTNDEVDDFISIAQRVLLELARI